LLQKFLPPQPISGFPPFFDRFSGPLPLLFEVPRALTFLINYGSEIFGGLAEIAW
jgi:hypothetical protein